MNWGTFAVNIILSIFVLGGIALLGYLMYIFFIKLKENLGIKSNDSPLLFKKKKGELEKGSYCKKCGSKLGDKDLFCSKCGGKK